MPPARSQWGAALGDAWRRFRDARRRWRGALPQARRATTSVHVHVRSRTARRERAMMQLDMELEAEFDAQAFGPELRALKVRIDDAGSSFVLAATVPWTAEPAAALELVKAELLREDEACFVLFRTRTWALISFTPPDAPGAECTLYDASCDKLQALLGGAPRVPNVRRWASLAEVQLDQQVCSCA